jgi:hypothetical protein
VDETIIADLLQLLAQHDALCGLFSRPARPSQPSPGPRLRRMAVPSPAPTRLQTLAPRVGRSRSPPGRYCRLGNQRIGSPWIGTAKVTEFGRTSRNPGELEQVCHFEASACPKSRSPVWVLAQIGHAVTLEHADKYLCNDATTHRTELLAIMFDFRLPQYVEPQRCPFIETERAEVGQLVGLSRFLGFGANGSAGGGASPASMMPPGLPRFTFSLVARYLRATIGQNHVQPSVRSG